MWVSNTEQQENPADNNKHITLHRSAQSARISTFLKAFKQSDSSDCCSFNLLPAIRWERQAMDKHAGLLSMLSQHLCVYRILWIRYDSLKKLLKKIALIAGMRTTTAN